MALILNIHTATETAIVNLSSDKKILGTLTNKDSKKHASFLHSAIKELLEQQEVSIRKLDAIGVTSGPGSYTGIRIGLATAKGLCYGLKIPLITYNSLEVIAFSTAAFIKDSNALYCPMIDARRMEVYAALYDYDMQEVMQPTAMILSENSFSNLPACSKIYFSGSGSDKFKNIAGNKNFSFLSQGISSESLTEFAYVKYERSDFENIPYAQPLYIKDFHTIFK